MKIIWMMMLAAGIVAASACKKSQDNETLTPPPVSTPVTTQGSTSRLTPGKLIGTWELRQVSGGNYVPTRYSPGNGNLLIFEDGFYTPYYQGQVEIKGAFGQESGTGGQTLLSFTSGTFMNWFGGIENDTLKIKFPNPDYVTRYYVKTP